MKSWTVGLILVSAGFLIAGCRGGAQKDVNAGGKPQTAANQPVESAAPSAAAPESTRQAGKETQVTPDQKVMTTPSGLKYVDLVIGQGVSPKVGQTVTVQYTGWLKDGTKFDSSYDHGQPLQFPLGMKKVIAGWDEGVATMKVGGKRKLIIPSPLAYGDQGFAGVIPPKAELTFDVELLGVK